MKWFLLIPALFCIHTILTLFFFIKIMKWRQAKLDLKTASWDRKAFVAIGIILDASYNYSPLGGSLVLWQFPRRGETLFTSHLQRIVKANPPGYRLTVAQVYCAILEFFDVGHCR